MNTALSLFSTRNQTITLIVNNDILIIPNPDRTKAKFLFTNTTWNK